MDHYDIEQATQAKSELVGMQENLRQRLLRDKANAKKEGERIDELLSLLDKNPDVERIVQLIGTRYR